MPPAVAAALVTGAFGAGGAIAGGVISSKAQKGASASEERISTQAIDYEKEQDAYNRRIDAEHYATEQLRKDRAEALDRQVEADRIAELNRQQGNLESRRELEGVRYGDYTGRISPYLSTGASANDRMARLLGLSTPGGA